MLCTYLGEILEILLYHLICVLKILANWNENWFFIEVEEN